MTRRVRDGGGSRLTGRDLLRAGSLGLRSRRVRAALSALGISIGIAAIVGVLGISQSSKSGLLSELGQLGNSSTVQVSEAAGILQVELLATGAYNSLFLGLGAVALLVGGVGIASGLAGTLIGVAATAVYALTQHWQVLIPPVALYGGIAAALAIGAIAGLYPATRAARLSPTEALRTA